MLVFLSRQKSSAAYQNTFSSQFGIDFPKLGPVSLWYLVEFVWVYKWKLYKKN